MAQSYEGGCQCGKIKYSVEADIKEVMSCNCSRCGKLGLLLTFVPTDKFDLQSGDDNLTTFHFNKHKIDHMFCATCGVQSFARGKGANGQEMVAINARCLDGVDVESLSVKKIDGRSA